MSNPIQHSYLLRLWRDHADAPTRVTLIAVECLDKPRHFANLDELFALLSAETFTVTSTVDRPQWDGDYCTPDDSC